MAEMDYHARNTTFFTEEHQILRGQIRKWVETTLAPHADEWERDQLFPRWVFEEMGKMGFFGLRYPEDVGGAGGDLWHTVVYCEEMPRCGAGGLTMAMLVQSDMATPIINEIGTPEQKEEFLAPAIRGEKIAALGVSEPGAGSDVAGIRTFAKSDGDDWVINGSKTFITNGTRADFITLAVRTDRDDRWGGLTLLLFPTDTPGFQVGKKLEKIGNLCSDTAELFFEDCRIPKRYTLGDPGAGFYYIMQNFQGERLVGSASATAGAQLVLNGTIEYCQQRKAFGKPLTGFQVTRHHIVDMETELEACRRLTYHAADLMNRGIPCQREISMAKLMVAQTTMSVMDRCLQLHGGMGYMSESKISRAWRDARLLAIGGGTNEIMKEIISKVMGL
jgi:citronellyl-CoA dehydrogenase